MVTGYIDSIMHADAFETIQESQLDSRDTALLNQLRITKCASPLGEAVADRNEQ